LSASDRDAVLAVSNILAGGSPSRPLEQPFSVEEAKACLDPTSVLEIRERGRWVYIVSPEEKDYLVVGKYLFFAPRPELMVRPAALALARGFHHTKISRYRGDWPNHVLCVYWKDDSRLEEMRELAEELELSYGGWKTDAQTRAEMS
jgi:hypothetical protein